MTETIATTKATVHADLAAAFPDAPVFPEVASYLSNLVAAIENGNLGIEYDAFLDVWIEVTA